MENKPEVNNLVLRSLQRTFSPCPTGYLEQGRCFPSGRHPGSCIRIIINHLEQLLLEKGKSRSFINNAVNGTLAQLAVLKEMGTSKVAHESRRSLTKYASFYSSSLYLWPVWYRQAWVVTVVTRLLVDYLSTFCSGNTLREYVDIVQRCEIYDF